MNYLDYIEYLKEADLYEDFIAECSAIEWKMLTPQMMGIVPEGYIKAHCTDPLNKIVDSLAKKTERLKVDSECINFDVLVFFKWMMYFILREEQLYADRVNSEIKKNKQKEVTEEAKELIRIETYINGIKQTVITYITEAGHADKFIDPDAAVSLYRELCRLNNWREKQNTFRPEWEQFCQLEPFVILPKEEVKEKQKANLANLIKGAPKQLGQNIDNAKESWAKLFSEDKFIDQAQKQMEPHELLEMAEYLKIMNILIRNCAKKYFGE